jgi:hypothetical protein
MFSQFAFLYNGISRYTTDAFIYGKDRYITTNIWNIHSFGVKQQSLTHYRRN